MAYPVTCSSCREEFSAPFRPTPGRILECPTCLLKHNDMTKSEYVKQLLAFLTAKLGPVKAVRSSPLECTILKGANVICKIMWTLQDPDVLTLPQGVNAIITVIDSSAESAIAEFTEEAGIQASIPNAEIRRF